MGKKKLDVIERTETGRELNDMQQQAASTTEGHILVLAGAGTGKTTVLTERALRLIRSGKAKPYQILSITFTNKAAREMMERISAQGEDLSLKDMWTCTFHSMCARILRIYPLDGFTSGFSIYDSNDSLNVVKDVLRDMELRRVFQPANIRHIISAYKNSSNAIPAAQTSQHEKAGYTSLSELDDAAEHMTCGEYARTVSREYTKEKAKLITEIYNAYQSRLMSENAMDFDDLLLNTLKVLQENGRARTALQNRFRYVMVDEYQDTNPVQYRLVRILSAVHGNLFCVGDDDQSIYSFRGADVGIIRRFEDDFPDAVVIRLEQNYRSTNSILKVSNAVIGHNEERFGKELWSDNGRGEKPRLIEVRDEQEEAEAISIDILRRHRNEGEPFSANAVLYRTHSISRSVEEAFIRNGIPYRVYGGISFYSRAEIKDILAYMTIIANPRADRQLLRIINVPSRRIGATSVNKLQDVAAAHRMPLLEVMRNADTLLDNSALIKKCREFVEVYDEIAADAATSEVFDTIQKILEVTGYRDMLLGQETAEAANRLENVGELLNAAAAYDDENGPDFEGFMANVALLTDQDTTDSGSDAVSLMTVHSAKGLEFDNVYVAGLTEDIFPNGRAVWDNEVEEERRLCYVAFTRARKRLILLSAGERYMYGELRRFRPSRFLSEIPRKDIDRN